MDEDGVQVRTLSAGARLAGRYQIEDLVGETRRSQMWRAQDDVLNRSVSVQVVGSDDAAAEGFLIAARRATAVDDPRFLRVLDAAHENGYAYVVREWASGVSLDNVLRAGPLSATRSISVVREVAEAVAGAHRAGVQHRCLTPARILVTHSGAIRVLGLATDQALQDPTDDTSNGSTEGIEDTVENAAASVEDGEVEDGEQADTAALGAVLYSCLVGRWPGGRDIGLPTAPREHGRLLRPRQVRAGVDRTTDAVCDRILGISPRAGDALIDAEEVARELAMVVPFDEATSSFATAPDEDDQTVSRGELPTPPAADGPPPAVNKVPPPRTAQPAPGATPARPPRRRTGARVLMWAAIALLVGLVGVITILLVPAGLRGPGGPEGSAGGTVGADASAGRELDIAKVEDFDPLGNGTENPETVANSVDGDPDTTWTTVGYFSELNLQKAGVGLLVDLGKTEDVSKVNLQLQGRPSSVEVLAAGDSSSPPASVDGLDTLDQVDKAGTSVSLAVRPAVETRYLVVWLTSLPEVETGTWRGSVAEISVRG